MIPKSAYKFCREDISKIENYDKASADKTQTWVCHHRLGIFIKKEILKKQGLYEKRPAWELCFLKDCEHRRIHEPWNKGVKGAQKAWNKGVKGAQKAWNKGIPASDESKRKNREKHLGKQSPNKGKKQSEESKQKNRESHLGKKQKKYVWMTSDYKLVIMCEQTKQFHPDWIKIEELK